MTTDEIRVEYAEAADGLEGTGWTQAEIDDLAAAEAAFQEQAEQAAEEADGAAGDAPNFAPGTEDQQGKLDEKAPIVCPNCKHEFQR